MSDYAMTVGELIERLQLHYKPDEPVIAQWYTIDDFFNFTDDNGGQLTKKIWKKVAANANPDYVWESSHTAIEQVISDIIETEKMKANGKA